MAIDWQHFTPWTSLGGGVLIGLAAVLLLATLGRIAGISGILAGALKPRQPDSRWRLAFLVGLLAAPFLYGLFAALPPASSPAGTTTLVIAGLLVGLGTRYGAGCTSGHGICGLARRSPRSLVAVAAFMGAGMATVYLIRHLFA